MAAKKNVPTQFRLDSTGNASPNELARFVDGELIEGAGITLVNGEIQEEVEFGNTILRSAYTSLSDISSSVGVLTLNFNLGTVFRFQHNEDITLSFVNIPVGRAVFFTLIRVQDQSSTAHQIDWENSAPTFGFPGMEPPILTNTPDAIDQLFLTTYNGGNNFIVTFIGNYA